MKQKTLLYLLFIAIVPLGCTSNRQGKEDLPFIDIRKNYPEKELILTDFADVSFIHLNAENADFLYKSPIRALTVTNNTIVVYDISTCSILFFSKDGTPKSRFNRLGQGPEEYIPADIIRILYDEETDEVFFTNHRINIIQVYSSKGQYKRTIPLPQGVPTHSLPLPQGVHTHSLVSFDDESFFMYNSKSTIYMMPSLREEHFSEIPNFTTYYWISKVDGTILDSLNLQSDKTVSLVKIHPKGHILYLTPYGRLIKGIEGYFLCNPETDTVYFYSNDKSLTPIFRKTPSVHDLDPKAVITNVVDISRYQFFSIETIFYEEDRRNPIYPEKYYFLDKETGEIFRQKIILPEYKGKEFQLFVGYLRVGYYGIENGIAYELDLIELKQAYEENRLSGKLKELVSTLNELEDNNVLMLVHFK